MLLSEIHALAARFVPPRAADARLYTDGARSWWPAHEIGHFLVATADECRQTYFGILSVSVRHYLRYARLRELAATSISQRLLRRSGHTRLADDEVQYTDADLLAYGRTVAGKRRVSELLRRWRSLRLPSQREGLEALLTWKAIAVGTAFYDQRRTRRMHG